jgi:hypothetical protein
MRYCREPSARQGECGCFFVSRFEDLFLIRCVSPADYAQSLGQKFHRPSVEVLPGGTTRHTLQAFVLVRYVARALGPLLRLLTHLVPRFWLLW